VVARLALVKERPPSETEAKINPAVFDNPNARTRTITKLIWKKQFEKFPHEIHGHAKGWAEAKSAVATYLSWESNELRLKQSPISKLKNSIRLTHNALTTIGPAPILTAKINTLHEELIQARKNFSHSTQSARNKVAQEELLTIKNSSPPSNRALTTASDERHSRTLLRYSILG